MEANMSDLYVETPGPIPVVSENGRIMFNGPVGQRDLLRRGPQCIRALGHMGDRWRDTNFFSLPEQAGTVQVVVEGDLQNASSPWVLRRYLGNVQRELAGDGALVAIVMYGEGEGKLSAQKVMDEASGVFGPMRRSIKVAIPWEDDGLATGIVVVYEAAKTTYGYSSF